MYHFGNEDIEVHDMSNYYSDANVCRYAIGQHDVFLRRGKVNHKVRNVITVAIGEIPEKTAELTANLYGLLGSDEDYKEYHHIGYDITASRIFENVLRFTENYNNNQKVFFITGARSAGGVANLLSKKLIDKFGSSSVYGYTFNAVSTINGNMIPEGRKLPNLKYAPIMNIYNDDEMMVMFTSEETNMYKYGTKVHMSLSENYQGKVKTAFNKVHPKGYSKNMKNNVVDIINRTFNINLRGYSAFVFGMTGTEWEYGDVEFNYTSDEIKNNYATAIHEGLSDERKDELLLFWAGLYNVSRNDSAYAAFENEAYNNVRDLEKLKNVPKDFGKDAVDSNTDVNAFNNAQNNSDNQLINTAISYENNNNQDYLDSGKTLIDAIKELARFYINNVPTYKATLRSDLCTIPASNANLDKKTMGAAAYVYRSYMFDSLTELKTDKFLINHKARTGFDGAYDMNKFSRYTGDFCGDFAMSAIRIDANGKRGEDMSLWDVKEYPPSQKRKRDVPVYGFNLHNTLAKSMYGALEDANGNAINDTPTAEGSWNFENAMKNLGYEKIKVTADMTIDDLKVGDLLISKDHAEFYVGIAYSSEYYRNNADLTENLKKKSGTKVIHDTYGPHRRLVSGDKAPGTFGWGNVHDEFPVEDKNGKHYTYFFKNDDEAYYRLCQCGVEPTSSDAYHRSLNCDFGTDTCRYEVIWRKK